MHEQGMTHRDLKPENILMAKDDTIKLADFGFAVNTGKNNMSLSLGTPLYMAPEIHCKKKYDRSVDVWAIGVIAVFMITGMPPFLGKTEKELKNNICKAEPNIREKSGKLPENFLKFAKDCMQKEAKNRPTAAQLLQYDFIKNAQSAKSG